MSDSEPSEGIELVRLAVRSGIYPVYEVFDGERVKINVEPELSMDAARRYFEAQGRFGKVPVDYDAVERDVQRQWRKLRRLAEAEQPA